MTNEKVVVAKIEKNGVVRPKAGSVTEKPWLVADQISAETGAPAGRKEVISASVAQGINAATASTQYGRWRVFNGVKPAPVEKKVKVAKPKKEKAPKAPAATEPDTVDPEDAAGEANDDDNDE